MKGKHHIVIESARLKYEFEIKRNITIIRGDSATGKTTLIELLEDYRGGGEDSAVRISSDVPCRVFADSSEFLTIIVDGAAFGPYMENVLKYADIRGNIFLYLPESFEWIILQSGTASSNQPLNELEHPEDYIDSQDYMSWEQYFTMLLIQLTKDDPVRQYQKSNLKPYYVQGAVRDRILKIMPEDLQKILKALGQAHFSENNQ